MPGGVGILETPRLDIRNGNSRSAIEKDPAM
jgi:hypothetical protein